jgi:penicillin amidase/acyl-homoserine-lactone acylase
VKRVIAAFFLALFLALGGVALWALVPERAQFDPAPLLAAARAYDARIARDAWGVPSIFGRRDVDVAYGLAWAHCEDDFETIQKVGLASRGKLASVDGFDAAPADYLVQLLGVWPAVEAQYESALSPATRALAEAYADGVNHYAALHPEAVLPGAIPATGKDIVAGFAFRTPFFYGLERSFLELFGDERRREIALGPSERAFHAVAGPAAALGSNAIAVAPRRSADGATRLLVNSHQPYTGPVAWYEVRLHSDEGWHVAGGVFPGSPVMLHGTGRALGWASTVNLPDLADIYVLETDPDDPNRYRLDGAWRELEVGEAKLSVRLFGRLRWTVTREVLRSEHGPVLRTDHGTYAIRYAGMGEIRQLEQLYRMNRATSFAEWQDAMRLQANPSVNYVYADREGHVAYFYNAAFPKRAPGWDWRRYLPGDRSDLIWREKLPWDALPRVVDPASGFVVSANHTPFRATVGDDNPREGDFAPELGIETWLTNRARRALELFGDDDAITAEEFRAYKFDKRYSRQSEAKRIVDEVLAADFSAEPRLAQAQRALADWRLTTEADDPHAALGVMTALPIVVAQQKGRTPPAALDAFREAVDTLTVHYGRLDPPWREVNRIRRGGAEVGVGGGPDVLRAVEDFEVDDDGRFRGEAGDTLVMFVAWGADGAQRIESIHQFGSATLDRRSPHYADQLPLFAEERTKDVPLDGAAPGPESYRPGEPRREALRNSGV